jgi:hypothetical protein
MSPFSSPNDQHLCIVPQRSPAAKGNRFFLPFEGDDMLSIILSKAFLLPEGFAVDGRKLVSLETNHRPSSKLNSLGPPLTVARKDVQP